MRATSHQLAQIAFFADLAPAVLSQLALASQIRVYQKQAVVVCEGDRFLPKFYAILSGSLLVQKTAVSGKQTTLRQLPSGEMFAAPALFGDGIAPATVTALQDSRIVTVEKTALLAVIQQEPEVALNILRCFNQRLQEMHQTIHGLVSERAVIRLVRLMQYSATRYGIEPTDNGDRLNEKLPHQQMARRVGITYEECVRLINKDLQDWVDYQRGGTITLRNPSALQAFVTTNS